MNPSSLAYNKIDDWYTSCQQQFFDMAVLYGYNHDEIKDIISQFFLTLLEKNLDFSTISNPRAYLNVAFKRRLIDYYRAGSKGQFFDVASFEEKLSQPSVLETIEQLQTNNELIQEIKRAYKKLPLRCKKIIYLKFYEGLNTDQIAEQTGLSKRSVYNNLFEGIKLLRAELNNSNRSIKVAALISVLPVVAFSTSL